VTSLRLVHAGLGGDRREHLRVLGGSSRGDSRAIRASASSCSFSMAHLSADGAGAGQGAAIGDAAVTVRLLDGDLLRRLGDDLRFLLRTSTSGEADSLSRGEQVAGFMMSPVHVDMR
jgi:hypothetical protein